MCLHVQRNVLNEKQIIYAESMNGKREYFYTVFKSVFTCAKMHYV